MRFHRGNHRIAIVITFFNLAIKLPVIRIRFAFESLLSWIKYREYIPFSKCLGNPKVDCTVLGYLFSGILKNWSEFLFYLITRDPFLQPTYFSLFGLINVQRADEECYMQDIDIWKCMLFLTCKFVWKDSHHFSNRHNFSFRDGKLRMHDYGSAKTQSIIRRYGKIIASANI